MSETTPSCAHYATRKAFIRLAYLSALILIGCTYMAACSHPTQRLTVSFGTPQSTLTSLIWLTEELGFFTEQGIQLDLHPYPSGKRALEAMMSGRVELAATGETPFVIASFLRSDLRLYATMGQSDNEIRVLARRDHGIEKPADLHGKTIATQEGSAVHFFLSSFMLYYQLDATETKIRFMQAEALPDALAKGEIDAFSMREPYLSLAKQSAGADKLIEFSVPGLYTKTYNIVGSQSFVDKYPGAMQKILYALHKGAEYADSHPQNAIDIISERLQLPRDDVAALWPDMYLTMTLNQGLLTTLQEEAQWVLSSGLIRQDERGKDQIPDFLKRLNPAPLSSAVPNAVGLIGTDRP